MEKQNKVSDKPIKLEDLLKLKKAEKPDSAFWDSFERELHEKAMKTVVCKPSLHSRIFPLILNITAQFKQAIPISALAILTIGLFFYSQKSIYEFSSRSSITNFDGLSLANSELVLSSIKTNFVKKNIDTTTYGSHSYSTKKISPVAPATYGVRYLAGNVSSANLATTVYSNTLF